MTDEKFEQTLQALEQSRVIQDQIFNLNDLCFTKCHSNLDQNTNFDTKSKQCIVNCVNRYFETFEMVGNTFPEQPEL